MAKALSWSRQSRKLNLISPLIIGGAIATLGNGAGAQVTPDNTLGTENSTVTSGVIRNSLPSNLINGGAKRGANLFHSFGEFNVDAGRGVYFTNPPGIENIISRVTGSNPSQIRGTLGVTGGNANLFLINPNGIVFGAGARLDVGGSFVATTANAIQFSNQGFFNASDPNVPLLLTVNPSALIFDQVSAASIINNSVAPAGRQLVEDKNLLVPPISLFGLRVPDGRSLLLVGGNVRLDGGGLNALGGQVEIGGLAGTGTVGLNVAGNTLDLSFPVGVQRADVSLLNGARVDASTIQIQGRHVTFAYGYQIVSITASGSIQIITLNNSSQGLVNLPVKPVDVSGQIAQGCGTGNRTTPGRFVVTGRGGLPPNPGDTISSDAILDDTRLPTTRVKKKHSATVATTQTSNSNAVPIVPATGVVFNGNDEVTLIAAAPNTMEIPWLSPTACRADAS